MEDEKKDNLALQCLLDIVEKIYGYDFHEYANASLRRRVTGFMLDHKFDTYLQLADRLLYDEGLFEVFLRQMSITVTEMFRDPEFYKSFRENIIPKLKTYPYIKVWHAGCATGEEVFSMAILLHEEGFLDRATIYATDFNQVALECAKTGIYDASNVKQYIENYNKAGGTSGLSEYYTSSYNAVKLRDFLKRRITFANHNLAVDRSFGEMNVILCRNVLIYFNKNLQNQVLKLFRDSLCHKGYLCLGSKETLRFTEVENDFEVVDEKYRIYQRKS